jgi:hypothetical protein
MKIKLMVRTLAVATAIVLGAVSAVAQTNTNTVSLHTNAYFNVNFSVTAYEQSIIHFGSNETVFTAHTMKLGTGDIVHSLLKAISGASNFTSAKLLFRAADVSATNENDTFVLRSGTNEVDVSNFLTFSFPDKYATVTAQMPAGRGATTNSTDYRIMEFVLQNTPLWNFDMQGLTIVRSSSIVDRGHVISAPPNPSSITAAVAGSGDVNGQQAIFKGLVALTGRKIEIK